MVVFSKKFQDKYRKTTGKDLFNYFRELLDLKTILYRMDWRTTDYKNVQKWLKNQIKNPHLDLVKTADAFKGLKSDIKIVEIEKYVYQRTAYKSDSRFCTIELWQYAYTTWKTKDCDCEDSAVLIYVLARLAGILVRNIQLVAGDVRDPRDSTKKVGHCYCIYRSEDLKPYFNKWFIIDATYFPDLRPINRRDRGWKEDNRYLPHWWTCTDVCGYKNYDGGK